MLISKDNYLFDVDIEATKEYYKNSSLCPCSDCRNYYVQARNMFPHLTHFLSEFGVDIDRPDELVAIAHNGNIDYLPAAYTVTGKILSHGQYEIDIVDSGMFLNIVINDEYFPNNHQDEDYFTISIYNISLPWVLDEPYQEGEIKKNWFSKIRNKLYIRKIVT